MISDRHIPKLAGLLMAAAVFICLTVMLYSDRLTEALGGEGVAMRYETELFDTDEVMRIEIEMEPAQWEEMLTQALEEQYYACNVTINGQRLQNVGIRPKGNTSLSAIAMEEGTDRYSFKLEFDHYTEGQTCYGLDKLILNNNYADATNMKEAIVYDMYRYLGADASLYNYAEIWVNGEYWGVYLALEAVEESFLLRNYGVQAGELYKPESMEMGGGFEMSGRPETGSVPAPGGFPEMGGIPGPGNIPETGGDVASGEFAEMGERPEPGERPGANDAENGPGREGAFSGGFGGNGGADLRYTDEELDSYSALWDGEVTDSGKKEHRRVVRALKELSEGAEPELFLDVENLLKYMAVHVFSVNMDSLSGNMAHNYYLYESGGRLNILPWDYNLAFGGMGVGAGNTGGASEMINDAIDTPFAGTDFFDVLLENEEYRSRYHEYLRRLAEEYVSGGRFEAVYNRIRGQIDELVEKDPTAFYSEEEYLAGAEMLYQAVLLRAESVKGQLEGTIPPTDEGQRADSSGLVDASAIDLAVMGEFNMGGAEAGDRGFPESGALPFH